MMKQQARKAIDNLDPSVGRSLEDKLCERCRERLTEMTPTNSSSVTRRKASKIIMKQARFLLKESCADCRQLVLTARGGRR